MRLKTDYIDLYQFHHVDRTTPWDEIWQAVEVATSQGKIIYAGSSNFAGWNIAQAQETAARRGLIGLVSEQSIYNLLTRDVELEVLPAVRAYGLGFLAWAPLHEGILGGRSDEGRRRRRRRSGRAAEAASQRGQQLAQFEDLATALGHAGRAGAGMVARPTWGNCSDHRAPQSRTAGVSYTSGLAHNRLN